MKAAQEPKSLAQIMEEMRDLTVNWANMPEEDYNFILAVPQNIDRVERHLTLIREVYKTHFGDVMVTWKALPKSQWETTKVIGRDMPEWIELRDKLINLRRALRKVKRIPKKVVPNAEVQPAEVSE